MSRIKLFFQPFADTIAPKEPSRPAIRFAEKCRYRRSSPGLLKCLFYVPAIAKKLIITRPSNRLKDKKTGADQVKGAEAKGRLQDPAETLGLLLRDIMQHGLATVASEVSTGKTCKAAVCDVLRIPGLSRHSNQCWHSTNFGSGRRCGLVGSSSSGTSSSSISLFRGLNLKRAKGEHWIGVTNLTSEHIAGKVQPFPRQRSLWLHHACSVIPPLMKLDV